MTEFEIWKPCLENCRYEVSTLGRVRSLGHNSTGGRFIIGRVLKPYRMPSGYMQVSLGRNANKYVHRLVCAAFHGEPASGSEVSHLDGTRDNNEVRNLKWSTHSENEQTKKLHGTYARPINFFKVGQKRRGPKPTMHPQAKEIVSMRSGGATLKQVGAAFGMSKSGIFGVLRNRI